MNERIRQLADEAVTRVALRCEGSMESDKHGEWIRYDDLEKFAELIVRECLEQVFYTIEDEEQDNISSSIRDKIKEHFGVEE